MKATRMNMAQHALALWWLRRTPAEQRRLRWVGTVVALLLLGLLAIAPALRTLRISATQRAALQAQLHVMQGLQAQARSLQSIPTLSIETVGQALQDSVRKVLGDRGSLSVQGDQATVTVRGVDPAVLAQWLQTLRMNAHLTPQQAQLRYDGKGWSGSVQLALSKT